MLKVRHFVVGPLQTNCYFISDRQGETVVVDPGAEGDFLSEEITRAKLSPFLIFFTHGHFDHLGGALPIFLNFVPGVFLSQLDWKLYNKANLSAQIFVGRKADPNIPRKFLSSDEQACQKLIGEKLGVKTKILMIPGHSPGMRALYFPEEKMLFAGDLIFKGGMVGRSDFLYSNPKQMKQSVAKVISLPRETRVYPGHEGQFLLKDFRVHDDWSW
jgi:glyoxylase-like metal-dependent hydrolase (beta-lactamase superfamily II)